MYSFQYYNPTKIIFGKNKIYELKDNLAGFGERCIIITGLESYNKNIGFSKITESLNELNIHYKHYSGIKTNPEEKIIIDAANFVKDYNADFIISLGGGSVHDAAKAITLKLNHDGDLFDYTVKGKKSVPGISSNIIPLITIPTISGTGAEISPASLVRIDDMKHIIFSPFLYPKLSIFDPSLMQSAPIDITIRVGYDAFIQGLEAYLASNSQPFSDLFALNTIKLAYNSLSTLKMDINDLDARTDLAFASITGLIAVAQSGVGAIHALSDPLSGKYNIHHGLALAFLTTGVLEYNFKNSTNKLGSLAEILNIDTKNNVDNLIAKIIKKLDNFIDEIGIMKNINIKDFGFSLDDLKYLIDQSHNPDMSTNITQLEDDVIGLIFTKLIK